MPDCSTVQECAKRYTFLGERKRFVITLWNARRVYVFSVGNYTLMREDAIAIMMRGSSLVVEVMSTITCLD